MTRAAEPAPAPVRCAIYTRKSTDENLDLEFNSLDAQRESAEAYIASQRALGWVCLPEHYDDGGYTGGNLDRPALQRLLADIAAGKVDCIVVYKIDRFTRSLTDFSKIVEVLDKHKVAFCAVTQQFNTATSLGRLMLNVLLSFAQFEREIISERTRDKIAQTRRKGKWTGGYPVLGYDVDHDAGKLVVNEAEAARVRSIFQLYLEHGAMVPVLKVLDERGWGTKRFTTRAGRERGGLPFTKSSLYHTLTNWLYAGKMTYKSEIIDGEHTAIVPAELFDQVQLLLKQNARTGGAEARNKHGALLRNVLTCATCGCAMTHAYTQRGPTKCYRYYVCQNAQKKGWHSCATKSVAAGKIEQFVVDQVKQAVQDEALVRTTLRKVREQAEAKEAEVAKEQAEVRATVKRLQAEVAKAAETAAAEDGGDCGSTAREQLAQLQEQLLSAERRLTQLAATLAALNGQIRDDRQLVTSLRQFDPVWSVLAPREQTRLIRLLIEKVAYDGVKGKVAVTFRANGLVDLANKLSVKEA